MRAAELLQRQFAGVHTIFHAVADDLSVEEWTARILPKTHLLGFDLWHVARTQDWAMHTLVRGVPEIVSDPQWANAGALTTPGIGVGLNQELADQLAHQLTKADVILYMDAVYTSLMSWVASISDLALDEQPDIPAHYRPHPEYLTPAMHAEVPWLAARPPVWRCLSPALGHVRDHLAEADLIKRLLRR